MLSTYASRTIHIYWWLSDYYMYYIEKTTYPPSGEPGASSCRDKLSLRCWAFAWLNDCANGDEADVTFVQTRKTQSRYYFVNAFHFDLIHVSTGYVGPTLLVINNLNSSHPK